MIWLKDMHLAVARMEALMHHLATLQWDEEPS